MALDLETTGLDPRKDSILSYGLVHLKGMSIRLETACHEIISVREEIPEASAVIHQITDDAAAAGRPLEQVLPEILEQLAGRVMLVHYARIEQSFLDAACRQLYGAPFVIRTIDTLVLARRLFELRNPYHPGRTTCGCSICGRNITCPNTRRTMPSAMRLRPQSCFSPWRRRCIRVSKTVCWSVF